MRSIKCYMPLPALPFLADRGIAITYSAPGKKNKSARSSQMVPLRNPARIVEHPPFVEVDTQLTHLVHSLGRSGHRLISHYCRLVYLCFPRTFASFALFPVSAIFLLVAFVSRAATPPALPIFIAPAVFDLFISDQVSSPSFLPSSGTPTSSAGGGSSNAFVLFSALPFRAYKTVVRLSQKLVRTFEPFRIYTVEQ